MQVRRVPDVLAARCAGGCPVSWLLGVCVCVQRAHLSVACLPSAIQAADMPTPQHLGAGDTAELAELVMSCLSR